MIRRLSRFISALVAAVALTVSAHAQVLSIPGVQQVGAISTGHVATWAGQLAIQDGGTAVTGVTTGPCLTSSTLTGSTFISGSNLVNNQTGVTYSVLSTDQCKLISISNGAGTTVTIPQAGTGQFVSGWMACFQNRGAGTVTLSAASGLIDTAGTLAFGSNAGVCLYTDGVNYFTQRGGAGLGTGTVTSVGLTSSNIGVFSTGTNITLSGNLSFALINQSANTVLAGPTNGSSATPAFRTLTGADLPNPALTALGGIRAIGVLAHSWISAISTSGVPTQVQPGFADLSGTLSPSQFPILTGSVFNSLGSVTVTISDAAISTSMLQNSAVTNAKLANMSGGTFKGALTTGAPTDLTGSAILDTIGNSQGQILIRNSTQWTILPAGTSGSSLVTQGTNQNPIWVAIQTATYSQSSFLTGATFTTAVNSSATTVYRYQVVGAGGGGGGAGNGFNAAGGGGAGGCGIGTFTGVSASTGITITVGTGGTAGSSAPTTGGTGSTSTIGSPVSVSATGGTGGNSANSSANSTGGAGGSVSGSGSTSFGAAAGDNGVGDTTGAVLTTISQGGHGAASCLGGGGRGGTASVGNAGGGLGSGGGGGSAINAGGFAGGAGSNGYVLIERMTP